MLEESVAGDPNSPNSHYELGMVDVFLKDWAPARQELEKAIAMGAKEPQAHYQLALASAGTGRGRSCAEGICSVRAAEGER